MKSFWLVWGIFALSACSGINHEAKSKMADSGQDRLADDLTPLKINTQLNILTNAAGMTVYVFDRDAAGVSNCNGGCAKEWPPVLLPEGELKAPLSIVIRQDKTRQVAYKARPLYLYIDDVAAGDVQGDGYSNVWHVARP